MTGTRPAGRPLVHPTVVRLTLRSLIGKRRGILLIALPVLLLAVAVAVRIWVGDAQQARDAIAGALGLGLLLPLVGLIAGTGVLATEVDDGSIVYLLAKPVPRQVVVASKLVVALGGVGACAVLPLLVAGVVLGDPRDGLGYAVGGVVGGVTYAALFLMLSALSRHPVVIGLIYVVVWEGLIGSLLPGVQWVSVARWTDAVAGAVGGEARDPGSVPVAYAVLAALVVVATSTVVAVDRLRSFRLTSAE
jgi:ABC-2 type transport system permease protein